MQGSIQKKVSKNGKPVYYVVVPVGPTKRKWIKAGPLKHEAERLLRDTLAEMERGFYKDLKRAPFKMLAEQWLKAKKLDKVKPRTLEGYEGKLRVYLLPYFGERIVSEITPAQIESFKAGLPDKLSPRSVNLTLFVLRAILAKGVRWGYCWQNPCEFVDRVRQQRKEFKALTKEEIAKLVSVVEGQNRTFFLCAVTLGLRQGELLAMRWKNLDFEKGAYTVRESLNRFGFDTTKTGGVRVVPVPKFLLEELRRHKARQNGRRLAAGTEWKNNDLIFPSGVGKPMDGSNLRKVWRDAKQEAELPANIRFHDLRGTAATLALESGASVKAVQNLLGHSTPNLTLTVYARITEDGKKDLAEKMDTLLRGIPLESC